MLINREALNLALITVITVSLAGCAKAEEISNESASPAPAGESVAQPEPRTATSNPLKNAYFGDTHIHTELSFDAFLFGTRRTPNDAYLFAKGAGIEHASGFEMKMKKPLDFLAVSFFMSANL